MSEELSSQTATEAATAADAASTLATQGESTNDSAQQQGSGTQGAENKQDQSNDLGEYAEFKAPEGITLDAELMTDFKGIAKEAGLNQDQAQKMADLGVKLSQKIVDSQQQALAKQVSEWESSSKTDKEFGGDKLDANLAIAKKALDAFATPELKDYLNNSGAGNHPELIRFLVRAGKAISEDKFVGGSARTADLSHADRLYSKQ